MMSTMLTTHSNASRHIPVIHSKVMTVLPFQRGAEELERSPCLGLLLAGQTHAALGEVRPGFRRGEEGIGRRALRRELEDAGFVRVQPQLGDQSAAEALG
jgi:hypothetical protein